MAVEPSEFYHYRSFLGAVECDGCARRWPCHLSAWGKPSTVSRCNICGGDVHWIEVAA